MFTTKEVANYYNSTQNHYINWWNLKKSLSLHYGIWDDSTKSFAQSLANTNSVLLDLTDITSTDQVLDAGCGVGGAAFHINKQTGASVTGISLSYKQVNFAQQQAKELGVENLVLFEIMDYTKTRFKDSSFDVIWACESISSAPDKSAFITEAHRLLKPGGRIIMSDFFATKNAPKDPNQWITKWGNTWGISNFINNKKFAHNLITQGFSVNKNLDYTPQITKSAKRMYVASLLGAVPSMLYNITHPRVSIFAKTHYLSGYYQYKALQAGLWKYRVVLAVKK